MSKFIIEGGRSLSGEVKVSGAKNAALPILAASLLTTDTLTINNVPDIQDIRTMLGVLESLGCEILDFSNHKVIIRGSKVDGRDPDFVKVKQIRASVLILGPLLTRFKRVKVTHPGGCHIGARPIEAHLRAFEALGATVHSDDQFYYVETAGLRGRKVVLRELSVTATENALLAAVLAPGITEIRLAAAEPEITNLAESLNLMGAKIKGYGGHTLIVEGVSQLHGAELKIIPDRIEAGTFAIAAAVLHSDVLIDGYVPDHLDMFTSKLLEANVQIQLLPDNCARIARTTQLKAVDVRTDIYPGFPTDLQAPFAVLLTQAAGHGKIFETMFEGRLNYLQELSKMGASSEILNAREAIISGPTPLYGKEINSLDIRSGATLILAALVAAGISIITNAEMIDRGYEKIEDKLTKLGAKIDRV
ncbi:TPA: UDP-N-acetylglucosamine 1-carboxyvinyltransferase [Patescibacteria group bacterium]|uniref:UDP-N-acetylglucosamine 1-carboxyvinyltransferase n=2 Tax=Bacteria division Kazan-3B-28 TaxID=1798534 RepID=A0A0G1KUF5_UNCK3|nr:MAG: UDP-N-acetylglucosamine 1-carboxyvinyltransferase [candidate division Kazan bacterium GW2011_GWA1_44_22]KKT87213.1 MAG: UDP-N-acetylglucosamine 1-carboxyvinyltransferase [candidate division Kazan bacterium GW2011_GWB1_45_10]HCR42202.1 UDP-N-acetylglucosamine 1-carboxyvinyltransferase [Patescibacteria group bacterium]